MLLDHKRVRHALPFQRVQPEARPASAALARRDPTVDRARNVWRANTRSSRILVLHALVAANAHHSPPQRRPERSPTGAGITVTTPTVSGCFLLRPASPLRLSIQSLATTLCMCISVRRHRVAQRRSWRSFPAAK
jgi:hypothetical protein